MLTSYHEHVLFQKNSIVEKMENDPIFEIVRKDEFKETKNWFKNNINFNNEFLLTNKLSLISTKFFLPNLLYLESVNKKTNADWYLDTSLKINNNVKNIGTNILLNIDDFFVGFEFFFGFDDGFLLLASKFGILAVIGLETSENLITRINEYRKFEGEKESCIFVHIIAMVAISDENHENHDILFLNDSDKIILEKVAQLTKSKFFRKEKFFFLLFGKNFLISTAPKLII